MNAKPTSMQYSIYSKVVRKTTVDALLGTYSITFICIAI